MLTSSSATLSPTQIVSDNRTNNVDIIARKRCESEDVGIVPATCAIEDEDSVIAATLSPFSSRSRPISRSKTTVIADTYAPSCDDEFYVVDDTCDDSYRPSRHGQQVVLDTYQNKDESQCLKTTSFGNSVSLQHNSIPESEANGSSMYNVESSIEECGAGSVDDRSSERYSYSSRQNKTSFQGTECTTSVNRRVHSDSKVVLSTLERDWLNENNDTQDVSVASQASREDVISEGNITQGDDTEGKWENEAGGSVLVVSPSVNVDINLELDRDFDISNGSSQQVRKSSSSFHGELRSTRKSSRPEYDVSPSGGNIDPLHQPSAAEMKTQDHVGSSMYDVESELSGSVDYVEDTHSMRHGKGLARSIQTNYPTNDQPALGVTENDEAFDTQESVGEWLYKKDIISTPSSTRGPLNESSTCASCNTLDDAAGMASWAKTVSSSIQSHPSSHNSTVFICSADEFSCFITCVQEHNMLNRLLEMLPDKRKGKESLQIGTHRPPEKTHDAASKRDISIDVSHEDRIEANAALHDDSHSKGTQLSQSDLRRQVELTPDVARVPHFSITYSASVHCRTFSLQDECERQGIFSSHKGSWISSDALKASILDASPSSQPSPSSGVPSPAALCKISAQLLFVEAETCNQPLKQLSNSDPIICQCARTVSYMKALCMGYWIIDGPRWLRACIREGQVADLEKYEVSTSSGAPLNAAPTRARMSPRHEKNPLRSVLFSKYTFLLKNYDSHNKLQRNHTPGRVGKSEAMFLIHFGGGEFVDFPPAEPGVDMYFCKLCQETKFSQLQAIINFNPGKQQVSVGNKRKLDEGAYRRGLLQCALCHKQKYSQAQSDKQSLDKIPEITLHWLLDSVSSFEIKPFNSYLVKESKSNVRSID